MSGVDFEDWCAHIRRGSTAGSLATASAPGHLVIVVGPLGTQARCTCGWSGPDRTDEPDDRIRVELVLDDTCWHLHEVGQPCPDPRHA